MVLSFRRGSDARTRIWRRTLEKGEVADGDLEFALTTMKKHRALEDTIERARHYGAMARDALELFAPSPWKHALRDAVEFTMAERIEVRGRPAFIAGVAARQFSIEAMDGDR